MSFKNSDRVRETTASTGSGDLTLAGAVSKFRAFAAGVSVGDRFVYGLQHQSAEEWEVGLATLTNATTLTRECVLASSNGGNLVPLSAGTKDVFLTSSAADATINALAWFGDGSDGNQTYGAGNSLSMDRDYYFQSLTISSTGYIQTNGFRIFVQEKLDIRNSQAGAIRFDGNHGGNANLTTAGAGAAAVPSMSIGGSASVGASGGSAATSATAAGGKATVLTFPNPFNGGASLSSGIGGEGDGSGTAGASTAPQTPASSRTSPVKHFTHQLLRGSNLILGGAGGQGGGGGGAASGGQAGGAGGGGASGGGVIWIAARIVERGGSAATGLIRANGGIGGGGGNGASGGSTGGGGGGSGGGGGWIYLAYLALRGSVATAALQVNGGGGGTGGNGQGTNGKGGGWRNRGIWRKSYVRKSCGWNRYRVFGSRNRPIVSGSAHVDRWKSWQCGQCLPGEPLRLQYVRNIRGFGISNSRFTRTYRYTRRWHGASDGSKRRKCRCVEGTVFACSCFCRHLRARSRICPHHLHYCTWARTSPVCGFCPSTRRARGPCYGANRRYCDSSGYGASRNWECRRPMEDGTFAEADGHHRTARTSSTPLWFCRRRQQSDRFGDSNRHQGFDHGDGRLTGINEPLG